jgi:uncharacterized protein (TIGR03067 family)
MQLSVAFLLLLSIPGRQAATLVEQARLQGEWLLVETADENGPDRGNRHLRLEIRGAKVTMKFQEVVTNRGRLALSSTDSLPAVEMRFGAQQPIRGVYLLDGEYLLFCFAEPGKPRPTSLTPTGSQWQEKWRRVRK